MTAIAIVAVSGAAGADPARPPRIPNTNEVTMTTAQEVRLPDEAYYSDRDDPFDRLGAALAPHPDHDAAPPVFALGLPRVADIGRGAAVPGVLLRRFGALRLWEVAGQQNLSFIVVDLRTGAVRVAKAFRPDRPMDPPEPSRSGPEPEGIDRSVIHYGAERLALPAAFGEAWPSTAFAATAILYDWVSNTAVFERRPAPDPVAEPFRAPSGFLDPAPAGTAGSGLTFAVPASVRSGDPIRVEVGLSAPRAGVALAHSTEEPDRFVMVAELLLFALDADGPVAVGVVAPVAVAGDAVSAAFSFDLARRPGGATLAGEYQAYLVSGRTVSGPHALTVGRR